MCGRGVVVSWVVVVVVKIVKSGSPPQKSSQSMACKEVLHRENIEVDAACKVEVEVEVETFQLEVNPCGFQGRGKVRYSLVLSV